MNINFNFQPKDFENNNKKALSAIRETSLNFLKLVNAKNVKEMETFFKTLDLDTNSICAAEITNQGAWRCEDCVANHNSIYCNKCWSQTRIRHKDHKVTYLKIVVGGTCDCGDHNYIDAKYFCDKHLGIFQSDEEIDNYINSCFSENLKNELKKSIKLLFKGMLKYYTIAINENKTKTIGFINVIKEFINCFGLLCKYSTPCCFIISELLIDKYHYKTKHNCLEINGPKGKILKSSLFAHDCNCHFIRLLLEYWPGNNTDLLYKLIQNYKIKKLFGLYYFFLYGEFFKNCINDFKSINFIIIFNDVLAIASNIPGLLDNIYESMIEVIEIFFGINTTECELSKSLKVVDSEKYKILKDIFSKLQDDSLYIIKPVTLKYLSNNTNIIFKLIDIAVLLQNINSVEIIKPRPTLNKGFKYSVELLDVEMWLLDIFAVYFTIFNYNNHNYVKELFTYFSNAILVKDKNKLKKNEYSFHIPLYRAFSIFLNRYCFYEANKNDSNVFKSFKTVKTLMPEFLNCCELMIKGIYKVFGFITGCEEGFFHYYGPDMRMYEYIYYYNKSYIYRDFCLLKYLLSIEENSEYLGFNKILELCQVENSNKPIEEYIIYADSMITPEKWVNIDTREYLKFSGKILHLILGLLRNNTSLIWNLGSGGIFMDNSKINDNLIIDIIKKDSNNFIELTKELIINQILIKENSATFTEIFDNIFLSLKDFFGEKIIIDIIKSLTNITLTQEKKAKFSLKDEILNYLDLNYIMYPKYKSAAEKYITEFKSKQVSIFNVHFYPINKFESKLTEENNNYIFFNEKNFDFLFKFSSLILTQKGYEILNEYFLSVILNYLSLFLCYDSEYFSLLREYVKTDKIIHVLENNNLKDEVKKSYCKFIVEKFRELEKKKTSKINENHDINEPFKNIINDKNAKNNNAKLSLKEKMKNKYKKKNDNLSNKLGINTITIEEKNTETCVICLKPIENNDIKKPFGALGYFLNDSHNYNAFIQTVKKEYKKHLDKDNKLLEFDKMYSPNPQRIKINIISCSHLIHFDCFLKNIMKSNTYYSLINFRCPLCNRQNMTYIPMIVQYSEEQVMGYLKGFNFNDSIKYGYNHIEKNEVNIETDKANENSDISKEEALTFRNNNKNFVDSCKHFIEGFIEIKTEITGIDLESEKIKELFNKMPITFGIEYKDYFIYLDNIEDKKYADFLWKNLFLSFKLMLKLGIIEKEKYFIKIYEAIKELKTLKFDVDLTKIIQWDEINLKTCNLLFLFSILFEYNEIEGYEKYILYMVLPIYAFGFFLRNIYYKTSFLFNQKEFLEHLKSEELYKFLEEETTLDSIIIQVTKQLLCTKLLMNKDMNININNLSFELSDNLDLLNLSNLKNKTFLQFLDELDILIEADSTNEKMKPLYENLKPIQTYKKAFQKILEYHIDSALISKIAKVLDLSLFGSCLPIKYSFIDLPELAIDFEFEIFEKECIYCKKTGQRSLICLDCGKKICDSRKCITELYGRSIMSFYAHTILCGGGRSAYLQSKDCSVLFISSNCVYIKSYPLYLNEFGEAITKMNFGKEFKLNKDEVKKALKMFSEYSYSNTTKIS